jgi:hypothetical protein
MKSREKFGLYKATAVFFLSAIISSIFIIMFFEGSLIQSLKYTVPAAIGAMIGIKIYYI